MGEVTKWTRDKLRELLDENELDLSMQCVSKIPVKELTSLPRATHLDLSCNQIIQITDAFCALKHLIRLNLSSNAIERLPNEFGGLVNLQHLDLFSNKLSDIPSSFSNLRKLRWLDLRDNPLDDELKEVAGDCLNQEQCNNCAKMMVTHFIKAAAKDDKTKKITLKKQKYSEKTQNQEKQVQDEIQKAIKEEQRLIEKETKRQEFEKKQQALAVEHEQRALKKSTSADLNKSPGTKPGTSTQHKHKRRKNKPSTISFALFGRALFIVILLCIPAFIASSYYCYSNEEKSSEICSAVRQLEQTFVDIQQRAVEYFGRFSAKEEL